MHPRRIPSRWRSSLVLSGAAVLALVVPAVLSSETPSPNPRPEWTLVLTPGSRGLGVMDTPWGKMQLFSPLNTRSVVPPEYPPGLASAGKGGEVTLEALIDTKGRPLEVIILKSSGLVELDTSAATCLRQWSFPVQCEGTAPVRYAIIQRIEFRPGDANFLPNHSPDPTPAPVTPAAGQPTRQP
jgi:TonB family protein